MVVRWERIQSGRDFIFQGNEEYGRPSCNGQIEKAGTKVLMQSEQMKGLKICGLLRGAKGESHQANGKTNVEDLRVRIRASDPTGSHFTMGSKE